MKRRNIVFIICVFTFQLLLVPNCLFSQRKWDSVTMKAKSKEVIHGSKENVSISAPAVGKDGLSQQKKTESQQDFWRSILPVITLILGIVINRLLDFVFSRRRSVRLLKSFGADLKLTITMIESQIATFDLAESSMHLNAQSWPGITFSPALMNNRMAEWKVGAIQEAVRHLSYKPVRPIIETIHNVFNSLDSAQFQVQAIRDAHELKNEALSKHLQKFEESLSALDSTSRKLVIEFNSSKSYSWKAAFPQAKDHLDRFIDFTKTDRFNIFTCDVEFLRPILDCLNAHVLDDTVYEFTNSVRSLVVVVSKLKHERQEFLNTLQTYAAQLRNSGKILNNDLDGLKATGRF